MSSTTPITAHADGTRKNALIILLIMPLFFSSNIIFGRVAVAEVEPFTLAFLRWFLTALIVGLFVWPKLLHHRQLIRSMRMPLLLMGLLGMWICGAIVYLALKYTTATNGTLIYTSSPVMIVLLERMFKGRSGGVREILGITLAFAGVVVIVSKGSADNVLALDFNLGDLLFVFSAFSWAIYSILLKSERFNALQTLPLFMLIAASGALLLAPFALAETILLGIFPQTIEAWANIGGIVIFASLLAFSLYQYGVKIVGASITGIYLYLLPVYGVAMAALFLGESLETFHFWGIALVLGGVILATLPTKTRPRD